MLVFIIKLKERYFKTYTVIFRKSNELAKIIDEK